MTKKISANQSDYRIQVTVWSVSSISSERLANLNDAILVNLKPNEDGAFNSNPFMPLPPMIALTSGNYNQVR